MPPVLTSNSEGVAQLQKASDEPLPPNGEYDSMADEDEYDSQSKTFGSEQLESLPSEDVRIPATRRRKFLA